MNYHITELENARPGRGCPEAYVIGITGDFRLLD